MTARTARPYTVVCVSIYDTDLEQLDAKVAELKSRGITTASRSQLLRVAVAAMSVDQAAPLMRKS